jgi:hypothetical protein
LGPPARAHALLWGLRRPADEAQLTQVIAAIASVDRRFGARFVEVPLDGAEDGMHAANVRSFRAGGIPAELECRAEQSLGEDGRIDLRFDGPELTLLVENKLYSGYGHEQVRRYLRAVRRLPSGTRSALIAVTRAVPTCGEPALDEDDRWLGSVRWAQLLPQLHKLPIADRQLAAQWRLFFDVLDEQGDLGMTRADAELIRAWARYLEGRNHLEDLLDQIWEAERRVKTGDDALAAADRELTSHGFSAGRRHDRWVRTHEPEEYLEADDVPTRLIELIATDVPLIVRSGILGHNVELRRKRKRRLFSAQGFTLPRDRRLGLHPRGIHRPTAHVGLRAPPKSGLDCVGSGGCVHDPGAGGQ